MVKSVWILAASVMVASTPVSAQQMRPDPRAVVERGVTAHGGDGWLDPGTLVLAGDAEFYDPETGEIRSHADDYRMWREFERGRREAHGADGKVRIVARSATGSIIFEVGYDGETTWTQDGIMSKDRADAYWASNFGFGIIRSALDEGFTIQRAPSRNIEGHDIDLIRILDPRGQATLFGFDVESGFIRYMAFDSPRGFHERIYDDFVRVPGTEPDSNWVQAREVTLFYDGVKNNTVRWREAKVGEPVDPAVFKAPAEGN